ncbi:PTS sugar transporter subunit IIA [Shimazuella alba]|uniref:PTS transporter subunit EIIA n=1 Tax=Shimazuella alba TaxID=2690964 RepID=A0A6I4VX01_9BACL|nr:PTS transporter subunit EIIA [Shimazuella alba]
MDFLQVEAIELNGQAETAVDAIWLAGDLLVQVKKVKPTYVEAMIKNFTDIGPYIVIGPGIAIPHARPEDGAVIPGLSMFRLSTPVSFGHASNDPVSLVCALAGVDETSHLMMLKQISQVLSNKDKLNIIKTTNDVEEVVRLFRQ